MTKDRAGFESKRALVLVVYGYSQNIRGQQIGGKLDALEIGMAGEGQRFCQCRFPGPGYILQQNVSARAKGSQEPMHGPALSQHYVGQVSV